NLTNQYCLSEFILNNNLVFMLISNNSNTNNVDIPEIIEKIELIISYNQSNQDRRNVDPYKHKNTVSNDQYNKILNEYNKLLKLNKEYRLIAQNNEKKVNEVRNTVRYRIGDEVIKSLKK